LKLRLSSIGFLSLAILIAIAGLSWAEEAATEKTKGETAVEEYFGDGAEIIHKALELVDPKLAALEEQLGFALVAEPDEDEEVERKATFDYYFVKSGEKVGAATVVSARGKWAPVTYLVVLGFDAAVTRVEVIEHSEKRGKDIEGRTFLEQFDGKTSEDDITLTTDITAVSGATVSSRSATEAVRAAIVVYEELILKGGAEKDKKTADEHGAACDHGAKDDHDDHGARDDHDDHSESKDE